MNRASDETQSPLKGKVLLMDDDEVIRTAISHLLELVGYEVAICADGWQALNMYAQAMKNSAPFDAVILDLFVGEGLDGKKTMEKLLEIDPYAQGIISSGFSGDTTVADFKKSGFAGVVQKPYKIETLDALLEAIIAKKTAATR